MRQLKRSLTLLEPDGAVARGSAASGTPVERTPPAQPRLQRMANASSPMDPPMQPPPRKRAAQAREARRSPPSALTPKRRLPAKSPSPPRPLAPGAVQSPRSKRPALARSPQRLLAPRLSWSDIASNSQELPEELRQPPSPPRRTAWRRRPPSDGETAGPKPDQNEGRFAREFSDVTVIGKGQFSTVFRAQNCIDRGLYAVKRTAQMRSGFRRAQLREVFALANVSLEAQGCPNIVRYFSSWLEDGRLHIQTELCACSLRDRLAQRCRSERGNPRFPPTELSTVLRHVASGLKVLHSCDFVHLDIKPDNILVSRNQRENGCYKIADLGLAAAALGSGCDGVSEGDCRYLAREIMRGDLSELPKADVFSLGLVLYELATNPRPLPCNGEEWHRLRDGHLDMKQLSPLPEPLLELLRRMLGHAAASRPPCSEVLRHPGARAPDDGLRRLEEAPGRGLGDA